MCLEESKNARAELLIYLKAFDEGFSNTVIARTSYTVDEIIEGPKFKAMYERSSNGGATILHIHRLNASKKLKQPDLKPAESL